MAETKVTGAVVPKEATAATRPDLFGTRGQLRPDGNGGITSAMMAADKPEYATPADSQVNTGFYATDRGLPWHVTLARDLGEAELMAGTDGLLAKGEALRLSGGNFLIEKKPLAVSDSGIIVPGRYATVRSDTNQPLGIVADRYRILQNSEIADFCDALVDSGEIKYETGGVMRNGAWFFLSMELNHLEINVPGDPSSLKTYLLAMTSHDCSMPASWYVTQVRTVCKNTSDLARKGALTRYSIRHTGTMAGKLEQARAALQITFKNTEVVKELTSTLATKKIVDAQVRELLEKAVWPVTASVGDEENERQSRHVDRAFEVYAGSPNLEGIRGTAWGAYNAVTEYVDHALTARTGSAFADTTERRAANILFSSGHETKERTLKGLLALVK